MNKIIAVNCKSVLPVSFSEGFQSEPGAFNNNTVKHKIGKFITKLVIADILKIGWFDINFIKNAYGKPMLVGRGSHVIDFNLSYTGEWVILAISTETNIGIDVELVEPINIDTASEFCVDREVKMIKSNPHKSLENYYKLWTLKESFLKIIGMGLFYPIKKIEFTLNDGQIECYNQNKIVNDYFFKIYELENILISLCMKNEYFPEKINVYNSIDSFLKFFYKNQYKNTKKYAKTTT